MDHFTLLSLYITLMLRKSMCDVKKYSDIYKEIAKLNPKQTCILLRKRVLKEKECAIINKEAKELTEMLADFAFFFCMAVNAIGGCRYGSI